ncbi:MAG: hypothetical protein RL654_284 [Pseudomonadota bacterium]|jgi:cyclic beta-1,2-glucan synthetase
MTAREREAAQRAAGSVGPLEPPIRSVLFGRGHFEQHAARLALSHDCPPVRDPVAVPFFPRLDENMAVIRSAVAALEHLSRDGLHLGPAAQWLLDNASLIDEQVNEVRRQLPARYFARLPVLRGEPLDGLPRIYGLAWAWVAHSDSGLDAELLCACLRAYDRERELSLAELWALPTTLRLVLIENLRRLAERTVAMLQARERAHLWLEQAHAPAALAELESLGQALMRRGVLPPFALQLSLREADVPHALHAGLQVWLDTHLPDPAAAQAQLHDEMTRDHQSVRNAITSLRGIDRLAWRDLIACVSVTVRTLARSPVFAAECQDTQDETLRAIEQLALDGGLPESRVAAELMRRVDAAPAPDAPEAAPGHWGLGPGREALRQALGLPPATLAERLADGRRGRTGLHLAALVLPTWLLVAWLMPHGAAAAPWSTGLLALAALLLALPASELVVSLVNRLISESVRPARLPRLALDEGLEPQHRTLVVIPCLLSSDAQTDALVAQLEQHHLSTRDAQVQYALLSDWSDASSPHAPDDEALLLHAEHALRALQLVHGPAGQGDGSAPPAPRFLLLHRRRSYSRSEGCWIGHERKRGKLEQLIGWLDAARRGPALAVSPFLALDGLTQVRHPVRHVMTLDSDTDMPPGRLLELVGVAAHPLNRPRLDAQHRRVVAGHAILQPRVALPLAPQAARTRFHRLFAGQGGIDPYSAASSEIYQDLHGEGTFTGKGLLDVQALQAVLGGRLPEGHVLSHDLLEGAIARCAGVSDVTLVEDAPGHPDVAASRIHRWTRGDWQLLPFLLRPGRWPMAAISRWKMIDNLRRSLVAPATLALIVLALATGLLPPGRVLLLVLLAHAIGPLLGTVAGLAPSRDDISLGLFWRRGLADIGRALGAGAWHLALLLDQALLSLDAIARALWRQGVSRRHLLEWTTAAAAAAVAGTTLPALARRHAPTTLAAAVLGMALALAGPAATLPWAIGLSLLWALAPVWVAWGARVPGPPPAPLAESVRQSLRHLARDTWRFYLRTVTPEENHLPPDNLQRSPQPVIASRTSPTNIGMYLLSVASARAFGFIGVSGMVHRLDATLSTLERLPRHRGHFLNWYDTRTLAVLPPAYVSTVDSGNLGGHLLAVAGACEELATQPQLWHGQPMLRLALDESAQRLAPLRPVLLAGQVTHRLAQLAPMRELPSVDAQDFAQLPQWLAESRAELEALWQRAPDAEAGAPGSDERSLWLLRDHLDTLEALLEDLRAPASLEGRLRELAARCRTLAQAPDYAMLFDPVHRLLHIGLRADSGQLDSGHYDLLASECRLTSLLAIAKGDVPVRHWAALGRPFVAVGDQVGLRSWSGSMFEYLMPSLVLDEPQGSVLDQATRAAVREQRAQGARDGLPWGVSESAHAAQDHTLAYQYGPQGAARLALRRTPPDERVIAPYATVMALMVDLPEAMANLQRLGDLQARGPLGFIEALDFTASRQQRPGEPVRVDTVMAHHQGMSLVALAVVLLDGAPRRWLGRDALMRAVRPLLHEVPPREAPPLGEPLLRPPPRRVRVERASLTVEVAQDGPVATQLLGNGRYSVGLRAHGGGWSRWQGIGISRWRDDPLRVAAGTFLWLMREDGTVPSAPTTLTAMPAPDPSARYLTTLDGDRVVFEALRPDLRSRVEVRVSPEDDLELRQVELENLGERPLPLRLVSSFEVTLSEPRADEAHPAFANLFVEAGIDRDAAAIHLRRKPRLQGEAGVHAVHFLAGVDVPLDEPVQFTTDRARWLGRWHEPHRPRAASGDVPNGPLDTGLDPVAAIGVRLTLAPGARARLTFATAAAASREPLDALVDKHRQPTIVDRVAAMSHTMAAIRLREMQLDAESWAALLRLTTAMTAPLSRQAPRLRPGAAPRCDRRLLWRHAVSGDRPILLVTVSDLAGLALVQTLKRALRLWTLGGLAVDLVVVNAEPASYLSPVQHELHLMRERHQAQQDLALPAVRRSTLHALVRVALTEDELFTLQTLARLHLQADSRTLGQQMQRWTARLAQQDRLRREQPAWPLADLLPPPNGNAVPGPPPDGLFETDTGAFAFEIDARRHPARPWINVLANPGFGALVSEAGGGHVWAGNSRMHMITAWSNDALLDPPSDGLLLVDPQQDGRARWIGRTLDGGGPRRVRHGQGWSEIGQRFGAIDTLLQVVVDAEAPLRQSLLRLSLAPGAPARRVRLTGWVEWLMGSARQERLSLRTGVLEVDGPGASGTPVLACTQLDHLGGQGGATAFVLLQPARAQDAEAVQPAGWTCDRAEFFDAHGRMRLPQQPGGRSGAGMDACAALALDVEMKPGRTVELVLLLGHGEDAAAAQALAGQARRRDPHERAAQARGHWDALLGQVTVETPDPLFDMLTNRWLPYQTLACRMWARAAFYQAGGAMGYRDQLQDAMALTHLAPELLERQILIHAARQFEAGDVQHWWHEPGGAGVRTHFSDDLLWLPLACARLIERTGRAEVLDRLLPFLVGAEIPPGAEDLYETPQVGGTPASIYEHCARAIDRSLRLGPHGLPLMGTGDWNDGMNRLGHQGRGESVWMAWFLCEVVRLALPWAEARGDAARVVHWRQALEGWPRALERHAWDGRWYLRAFFDDGSPLGSAAADECRIDLIAQAWAVLSGAGDPQRARQAMDSAWTRLFDAEHRLLVLLDPPLQHHQPDAGYIQAYPPGVRENGGQYSHAAVWGLMAMLRLGQSDRAWTVYTGLSPAHRWSDARLGPLYALEPYVMAGDTYSQAPWAGRGGWSWYTGSAAWLLRASLEHFCGLRLRGDLLALAPCLPPHWPQATLRLALEGRTLTLHVARAGEGERLARELGPSARRLAPGELVRRDSLADGAVLWVEQAPSAA